MRRQGVEDVKGKMPVLEPAKEPRRRRSKAELREQAEAAVHAWRAGQTSKNKCAAWRRSGNLEPLNFFDPNKFWPTCVGADYEPARARDFSPRRVGIGARPSKVAATILVADSAVLVRERFGLRCRTPAWSANALGGRR
jgi:hypothetical protein